MGFMTIDQYPDDSAAGPRGNRIKTAATDPPVLGSRNMNAFEDQGFDSSPTVAITGSGSEATGTAVVRSETGAGTSICAAAGGKDSARRGFVKKRAARTTTKIAKIRPPATVHRPTTPPVFTGLSETPGMRGISGLNRSFRAGELGWSGMNAISEV
jgi:hypothetical protein